MCLGGCIQHAARVVVLQGAGAELHARLDESDARLQHSHPKHDMHDTRTTGGRGSNLNLRPQASTGSEGQR